MTGQTYVRAVLEQGVSFAVVTGSGQRVGLDGSPSAEGLKAGPGPMEMLLASLAGCTGTGVIGILRKMRQRVSAYEVHVHAERREQHPRVFTHITVEHILVGDQLDPTAVARAIKLNEERYCAVSVMLRQSVPIVQTFQIRTGTDERP